MNINYLDDALSDGILAFMRNQAGWGNTLLSQAHKAIQNTLYSVVAFDEEKVVGIGRLVGDGALIWYIQDLIVVHDYQNIGIGSTLMNKLLEYVYKNSIPDSVITIGLMSAKGKDAFYQKFGFRIRPNENEGAGMVVIKKV